MSNVEYKNLVYKYAHWNIFSVYKYISNKQMLVC